jgi:hypothetical protein
MVYAEGRDTEERDGADADLAYGERTRFEPDPGS